MTLQQCTIAAQTVLPKKDIPIGLTIIAFAQFFGGAISVSICQTVLSNTLTSQLARHLPEFDSSSLLSIGATQIPELVNADELPIVLQAYNAGVDHLFYVSLAASCLAFMGSFFIERKSVKVGESKTRGDLK